MSDVSHVSNVNRTQHEESQMTLHNTSTYFSSCIANQFVLLYEHLPAKKAEDLFNHKTICRAHRR